LQQVVNVLDDFHNPGLRDAIKAYSQWPTIPQLYVASEFVGGADIVEEMHGNGQLAQALRAATQAAPAGAKQTA
jgi:glutaredoxin-related protein